MKTRSLPVCFWLILMGILLMHAPAIAQDSLAALPPYLREIRISGNKLTRDNIILRELTIQPGHRLPRDSAAAEVLEANRLRLNNLALFTVVNVAWQPVGADTLDMSIDLRERWYIWPEIAISLADRNLNVWWNEQNHDLRRVNARLSITHQNFRGNRENLSGVIQGGYTQALGFSYRRPYIDKQLRFGAGLGFLYSRNKEYFVATDTNKLRFLRSDSSYIFEQYDGTVSVSYRPGYVSTHSLQLRYSHLRAAAAILEENPHFFYGGRSGHQEVELQYRVDANHTDNWSYPLRGTKLVQYVRLKIFPEYGGWQAQVQPELGYYKPLPAHFFAAAIFRGRLSFPERQPYFLQGAMGRNSEYVRGYEYYVIDGSHYALGRANLKFEALNHTFQKLPLKYLPTIPLRIYPKIFADAGWCRNLWPGSSTLNNRWLASYGAGVDIVTAYDIRVRIEYTVNALGQGGLFFNMSTE